MSYTALTYHIVFSTYRRRPTIMIDHERELYKYIYDFATERAIKIRRIGGMPDHVHILCDIPPKIALADFIRSLKSETSKFLRVNINFPRWEGWTEGYAAFTIDATSRNTRVMYIMNQKHHHRRIGFIDELKAILQEAGITEFIP